MKTGEKHTESGEAEERRRRDADKEEGRNRTRQQQGVIQAILLSKDCTPHVAKFRELDTRVRGSNESGADILFSCTVHYPKQFHALRVACCEGGDFNLVESLSRSGKVDTTGGKSAATFSLTQDQRFMLKYVSKHELKMFIHSAPAYFKYMAEVCCRALPSLMMKILGVFTLSWKSTSTKQRLTPKYVVLQPNLFYERPVSKIFDLKGSARNRYVKAEKVSTGPGPTLLDENLLEYMQGLPISVTHEAKLWLTTSIYNDTIFLSSIDVVDYSVLVGLDHDNNTISAGIIDYIRKYNWAEKFETGFKSLTGKSAPTVINPQDYKTRFRSAINRYFVLAPDQSSDLAFLVAPGLRYKEDQDPEVEEPVRFGKPKFVLGRYRMLA